MNELKKLEQRVTEKGLRQYDKTLKAETNKIDNQQHENHPLEDIWYSGPQEDGLVTDVIHATPDDQVKQKGGF